MKRDWIRWCSIAISTLCLLTLPITLVGAAKAKKAAGSSEKTAAEDADWDVTQPPGKWKTIVIDTEETTWSDVDVNPDGSTIVFDMLGDIYTVPIQGGDATALTAGIDWNFQPKYSPDGSKIAFVSDRGGADNVWIMHADGSEPRAVSDEKEHLVHNPSWSHDGEYIVAKKGFTSTRSIPAGEIWLFHHGGGGGLQLIERPNKDKDQKTIAEPAFSHDDRYVYFSQDVTPGRVWQYNKDATGGIFAIKRLDRQTGKVETFVSGPGGAVRPIPSPDGKKLAFVKRTPGQTSALYIKDLTTGLERPVYDQLDRDLQETNGSQGNANGFGWTPDSEALVFWAGGKIRRLNLESRESQVIPVRVRAEKKIHDALRFPVDVDPDEVEVRMLRWAQMSPSGSTVVFQALGHLYIKDLKTGEQRRLTRQTDHFEFYPSFSRDGSHVVFSTWSDDDLGSLRIVRVDGGASRTLTTDPGHYVEPRFSPDGKSVVFRKITGGYLLSGDWSLEPGIHLVAVDSGEIKKISPIGFDAHFGAQNDRIYFSDNVDDTQLILKSVNLEGHDERTHLKGQEATEFRLSPDGRWVAFTEQFNVYLAPFTMTGEKTVEIGPDSKSIPLRQVSKRSGEFLHWSADSRQLHWAHGATLYSRSLQDAFGFIEGSPGELPEPVEQGLDLRFRVPAARPEGRIAVVGGRIVTMREAEKTQEIIEDGVVLIEGDRIKAVGRRGDVSVPADAYLLDATGMTIVPGLVDVHAHGAMARDEITPQQNWMQFSNLSFGVTTVHDPSNDTSSIFSAAELQRTGGIVAPRIFSTGTILYGAHAPGYTAAIENLDDARFHVRRLKDVGAISVKSYQQPRRDQRQQVIAAGEELGIMVVPEGGAKFQHNMNQIVDGHTGIEHAIPITRGYEDVLQLWQQSETGYTPTFGVAYGGLAGEVYWYDRTEVWANPRLMRYVPKFIVEPRSMRRITAPDAHYNHISVARFAKALRDRGVSVQIGAHGQREGLAAHWEMWMMQQGGFSAWEALRGATIDGAAYVGLRDDIGSIETGKLADLAIIDGNPLEDIHRSEYVAYTMIDGRLYDTSTMNQIAPQSIERGKFFFEREGGDTIHPATSRWLEELEHRYGWVH